jgi:hypothetical protein
MDLNVTMKDGQLFLNGQRIGVTLDGEAPPPTKVILNQDGTSTITGPVHGDLIIEGTVPVTLIVQGDIHGSVNVVFGSVQCGDVGLSVDAGGDVTCGNVNLSVDAKGNVTCGDVNLGVTAQGRVSHR